MNWNLTGAILMGLGVALGAFGAHGLRGRLDAYSMGIYEKAVFYQFIHSLGLLVVSYLPKIGALPASAASTGLRPAAGGRRHFLGQPLRPGRKRPALAGRRHADRRPELHRRRG